MLRCLARLPRSYIDQYPMVMQYHMLTSLIISLETDHIIGL